MNINPSYETIGSVFEKNILFEVPKYQRYYAWDDEQVDDFIRDIDRIYQHHNTEKAIEHFFGGIVVVKKAIPGSNRQQRELIDGQQRITTTILLIIGLLRKLEKIKTQEYKEEIDSIIAKFNEKYLVYKDRVNRQPTIVSKIVLSNADKSYFEAIIAGRTMSEERASHKKLKKAFEKIQKYIDSIINKIPDISDKIEALSTFEDIVHNDCSIIFIDADSRETAYKLFQVLNDRGAGLTEGDLLKSKTLEVMEQHFSVKQETLQNAWDEILKDDPKQVETFLRYYFASVCGSRVGRTSLYDEFLKQFFPSIVNKDEITEEAEAIEICDTVSNLLTEMCNYRKIIAGEWPFETAQPITEWDRKRLSVLINYLNFDIVHPLLLAAVKLGQNKFANIVYLLEKFMFRYKSVCNLGHQKLSDIYMKEAVKIREDPNGYRVSSLRTQLFEIINADCPDDVFKVALSNLRYHPSGGNKQLKYLFSMLEEHNNWYVNGAIGKPQAQKELLINYENITIEHISAQSPIEPEVFIGDEKHKLKNLTLLTPTENDDAANGSYSSKKPIYLSSAYKLNQYFTDVESWTTEEGEKWENYIKDFLCKIFVI